MAFPVSKDLLKVPMDILVTTIPLGNSPCGILPATLDLKHLSIRAANKYVSTGK